MPWIQIKIITSKQHANLLETLLLETGAVSVTFQDAGDQPIFEPLPGELKFWDDIEIVGLYEADPNLHQHQTKIAAAINKIKAMCEPGQHFIYKIEHLEDKQWEREWMIHFHPMRFGQRLWVCPSMQAVPDPSAVNVILDPGLAFGTGTHPTTALCLEWLDSLDLQNKILIDFGCGSGILAIAALKLGAKQAIGIDIDPQAIEASRDNAQRNGVSEHLVLYLSGQEPKNLQADVVVANILAAPLCELAAVIADLVKPDGYLGLSGILSTQSDKVSQAYQHAFCLYPIAEKEEWCRITAVKNKNNGI